MFGEDSAGGDGCFFDGWEADAGGDDAAGVFVDDCEDAGVDAGHGDEGGAGVLGDEVVEWRGGFVLGAGPGCDRSDKGCAPVGV